MDIAKEDSNKSAVVVEISHLKKSFGTNDVLKDINLTLHKGENLVILGRSGQGKSVTIKCVVGLLPIDGGNIKVFEDDIAPLNETQWKALRKRVGFLFQNSALYDSMTVRENLEFPLTRVSKMRKQDEIDVLVKEVLDGVGLPESSEMMPSGLSGGMKKRVALARTLILKPEIMLYDEPTTGLDPITSREISELILQMQRKYQTSSIIITHDIACAKITGDRIMIMNDGVFIEEGSFEALEQSSNELVKSFFK